MRAPIIAYSVVLSACWGGGPLLVPAAAREVVEAKATDPYGRAVLADGPVSFHRFNEPSGKLAVDSTGNGHDGTYKGGVRLGFASAYPALGTCAQFDGNRTRVQIPIHSDYKFGKGDFSIELWFNCHKTLAKRGELFKYKGQGKDFSISKPTGNNNLIAVARPDRPFQAQTDPFLIGLWHHVVYVRKAGVDRWYVDGALSGTATGSKLLLDMDVDLVVGADHNGDPNHLERSFSWEGLIDEMAIYARALSDAQVKAHYQAAQTSQ